MIPTARITVHESPRCRVLPLVPLKVFQLYSQLVVVGPGQHVDVLVAEPKLMLERAEAVFVLIPVAIETFSRLAVVAPSLDYLKCRWPVSFSLLQKSRDGEGP